MFKINYDALGIAASVACAIHCAILPILLTSLPILGVNIINNIWFEIGMILLATAIGVYSLRHGFKKHHHNIFPIVLFIGGIGMLILKQIFHAHQLIFLIPALVLIISAHFKNFQLCRKANSCQSSDCIH
jgi:uncharacterized membrane protein